MVLDHKCQNFKDLLRIHGTIISLILVAIDVYTVGNLQVLYSCVPIPLKIIWLLNSKYDIEPIPIGIAMVVQAIALGVNKPIEKRWAMSNIITKRNLNCKTE
jgi:hypothetical protein